MSRDAVQALKEVKWAERGTPAGQSPNPQPGVLVDFILLTTDASLLTYVQEASASRHILWQAKSPEEVVEHLVAGRCGILLADLALLRGSLHPFFDRIATQFPCLVLIAAGRREDEGEVAALVSSGRVYRFLHKPLSPGRTQQFVGAATRRFYEINARESVGMATVREFARVHVWQRMFQYAVRILGVLAVVLLAVLLFSTVRYAMEDDEPVLVAPVPGTTAPVIQPRPREVVSTKQVVSTKAPAPPAVQPAAQVPALVSAAPATHDEQRLSGMLEQTKAAVSAGRLLPPAERNALDLLREARVLSPDDSRVLIAATAVGQRLLTEMHAAARRKDLAGAQTWFAAARALDVEFALELPELQTAARAVQSLERRAVTDQARAAVVRTAVARREAGQLIEPAGASAFDEITALRERMPQHPAVLGEVEALALALLERAREAMSNGQPHAAEKLLAHIDVLMPRLEQARALRRVMQPPSVTASSPRAVDAQTLKRIVEVAPDYPLIARERGIEGWAELEFTIESDGFVSEIYVRAAQPLDVFNDAAIQALRRWRFEPVVQSGMPVRQRAWLRLTFSLR